MTTVGIMKLRSHDKKYPEEVPDPQMNVKRPVRQFQLLKIIKTHCPAGLLTKKLLNQLRASSGPVLRMKRVGYALPYPKTSYTYSYTLGHGIVTGTVTVTGPGGPWR